MSSDREIGPAVSPVFIDVEASALIGGYPIEIGLATPDARLGTVLVDSILINPADTSWLADCLWDPKAEALHRVTMADLRANGLFPALAADVISLALGNRVVYSDNPESDGHWIEMLYALTGARRQFGIADKSAPSLIVERADARSMGDLDYTAAEQEARRRAGRRHRAGPDAAYWAHFWLLVEQEFRASAGTRPKFGPLRRKPI